jgi:hypothetical protein
MKLHIMLSVSLGLVGGAASHAAAQGQGGAAAPPMPVAPAPSSGPAPVAAPPVAPSTPPSSPSDPGMTSPPASTTPAAAGASPIAATPVSAPEIAAPPVNRVAAQFLSLGRQDGTSRVGAELGYVSIDDNDMTPLRIGLYGQYVTPNGLGVYGALQISHASIEGESATALGNLELGGVYASKLGTIEGVGRVGIALPTAADDDFEDMISNVLGSYSRLDDVVHALPDSTWLRLSGSPIVRRQGATARADFGIDLPVATERDIELDAILHANFAAGLVSGPHQISLELVNLFFIEDEIERLHSAGASYRFDTGAAAFHAGIFKPFSSEDDLEDLTFTLVAGVSASIDG